MVRLYASDVSFDEVGKQLGLCANTVRTSLQGRKAIHRDRTKPNPMDRTSKR
jgi:hypothetical protein